MEGIASIDLFVVPTIAFQRQLHFCSGPRRRLLLWFAVTRNRRLTGWRARSGSVPWDGAPKYLIRYNDRAFALCSKLMYERWDRRQTHVIRSLGKTDMLNADRLDPARGHGPFAGGSTPIPWRILAKIRLLQ